MHKKLIVMPEELIKSSYREELEASLRSNAERDFIAGFKGDNSVTHMRSHCVQKFGEFAKLLGDNEHWPYEEAPYDHQKEAVDSTVNYLANPKNASHGYTVIPTGGGKTFIFKHLINAMAEDFQASSTGVKRRVAPPTIILVPTEDLVDQTREAFQHDFPNLLIGEYYGKKKQIQPVTIMVYNSFVEAVDKGWIKPGDVSMLMMDEAHRGLSDLRQDVFEKFKNKAVTLAYTATPEFGEDKKIESLFGDNSRIYSTTVRRLIDEKCLAPVDNYIVHVDIQLDKNTRPASEADLRTIIRVAKMKAAMEFMVDYEDPVTGHMLLGDTTVGFNRFTNARDDMSSAAGTARYFNHELGRRAKADPFLQARVGHYDQLAEYVGSSRPDSSQIIEQVKQGKVMTVFNVRYAREGTDIRRATNLLNIQGSNSLVDTLQGGGRVLRKWEVNPEKRAKVVDFFATVNGKATEDKPIFFYEAIHDESIVQDIVTRHVHIDAKTAAELLAEGKRLEEEEKAKNRELPRVRKTPKAHIYLGEKAFVREVLGAGDAAPKYRSVFDHFWKEMKAHYERQFGEAEPIPYVIAGKSLDVRLQPGSGKAPVEFAVDESAVEAFRSQIRFPSRKTAEFLDKKEVKQMLLGKGQVAQEFGEAFEKLWEDYSRHYDGQKYRIGSHKQVYRSMEPYRAKDREVRCVECIDDKGNLMLTVHRAQLDVMGDILGVPHQKTPRWQNKDEFSQLLLNGVRTPHFYNENIEQFWSRIEKAAATSTQPNALLSIPLGEDKIPVRYCMNKKGEKVLCIAKDAAGKVRKNLGIPQPQWQHQGIVFEHAQHKYSAELTDTTRIVALRDGVSLDKKTPDWLTQYEMAKVLDIKPEHWALVHLWAELQDHLIHSTKPIVTVSETLKCGVKKAPSGQQFCVHRDHIDWVRQEIQKIEHNLTKTDAWLNKKEFCQWAQPIAQSALYIAMQFLNKHSLIQADEPEIMLEDGRPIVCRMRDHTGHFVPCFNKAALPQIKEKLMRLAAASDDIIFLEEAFEELFPDAAKKEESLIKTEKDFLAVPPCRAHIGEFRHDFVSNFWRGDGIDGVRFAYSDQGIGIRKESLPEFKAHMLRAMAKIGEPYVISHKISEDGHEIMTYNTGREVELLQDGAVRLGWDKEALGRRYDAIGQRMAGETFLKPQVLDRIEVAIGPDQVKEVTTQENGRVVEEKKAVGPNGNMKLIKATQGWDETIVECYKRIAPEALPCAISPSIRKTEQGSFAQVRGKRSIVPNSDHIKDRTGRALGSPE